MKEFVAWVDRLSVALAVVASVMLSVAVAVITYMVFNRALGNSTYWEIEFSIYMMVASVFLGSPYCLKTNGHVGVDLLAAVLPKAAGRTIALIAAAIGLLVCLYLAWVGLGLTLEALHSGERGSSMWRPLRWPLYATMPVGLGLTAVQYVCEILKLTVLNQPSDLYREAQA